MLGDVDAFALLLLAHAQAHDDGDELEQGVARDDGVRRGAERADCLRAELSADRMLEAYCTLAYAAAGSYQDAARRLGLDRRTVKARIDRALLAGLKGDDA